MGQNSHNVNIFLQVCLNTPSWPKYKVPSKESTIYNF